MTLARLRSELAEVEAQLRAHTASWEYAFAMGAARDGACEHPLHWQTRARTDELLGRRADLRAQVAEHAA